MKFEDRFIEKYRAALYAARKNDRVGVIDGLNRLSEIFAEQYAKDNGDSIVMKAKLKYWQDTFDKYAEITRQYGLKDKRVQKLFGLINDDVSPSFADIMSGKADGAFCPEVEARNGKQGEEVIIDGIIPDSPNEAETDGNPLELSPELQSPDEEGSTSAPSAQDEPLAPECEAQYVPDTLKRFIGQSHITRTLLKEIAIAKNEGRRHLDNILLLGNPGLGKTTLMELIAKELGVKFELLDCSQFRNSQQSLKALQNFFMRVARDNEPVVIALDEIHMLNNELQSSLLTLLNNRVYVSPLDVNGQCKRIPIDEFTFIAATTDDDKVLDTVKNRCLRLKFQMVDYTPEELKQIYKNKVASKGLTITDEAIDACIPRSRGAIRYVNSIVEGLNSALYSDEGIRVSRDITLETALKYFEEKGIDPLGLERKDLEILKVIGDDPSGAISADVLSARVGLDPKKYMSEYERYLIKIGFINVTGRGRSLNKEAIDYLRREEND